MYAIRYGHLEAVKCMLGNRDVRLDMCTKVNTTLVASSVDELNVCLHSLAERNECTTFGSLLPATGLPERDSLRI